MIKIVAVIATAFGLMSCSPDIDVNGPVYPKGSLELPTALRDTIAPAQDTIQEINISGEKAISITIEEAGVELNSNGYNIDFPEPVRRIVVEVDENNSVTFYKVNDIILYNEASQYKVNHTYRYLEGNCLEILPGNTLDAVLADHNKKGYRLTRAQLNKCNPSLQRNGYKLQVGDILCLQCN